VEVTRLFGVIFATLPCPTSVLLFVKFSAKAHPHTQTFPNEDRGRCETWTDSSGVADPKIWRDQNI